MLKLLKKEERVFKQVTDFGSEVKLEALSHVGKGDNAALSSGISALRNSSFEKEFAVNEFIYLISGELFFNADLRELVMSPGDMLYISKGEKAKIATTSQAVYLWVSSPVKREQR